MTARPLGRCRPGGGGVPRDAWYDPDGRLAPVRSIGLGAAGVDCDPADLRAATRGFDRVLTEYGTVRETHAFGKGVNTVQAVELHPETGRRPAGSRLHR